MKNTVAMNTRGYSSIDDYVGYTGRVPVSKKSNAREKSKVLHIEAKNLLLISTLILMVGIMIGAFVSYYIMNSTLIEIDATYQASTKELEQTISEKVQTVGQLSMINIDLKNSLIKSEQEKSTMTAKLTELEKRKELYNKYEYIIQVGGNRTDLTYDQISYGEQLMIDRKIDPNLLFGVVYLESKGKETAASTRSTARGYGQFLGSTAKSVYENMLKKGPYNHDMAFNGYTNLELTAEYLKYLMKNNDGNVLGTLISYNGGELGRRYYDIVNNILIKSNKPSLINIQRQYQAYNL